MLAFPDPIVVANEDRKVDASLLSKPHARQSINTFQTFVLPEANRVPDRLPTLEEINLPVVLPCQVDTDLETNEMLCQSGRIEFRIDDGIAQGAR